MPGVVDFVVPSWSTCQNWQGAGKFSPTPIAIHFDEHCSGGLMCSFVRHVCHPQFGSVLTMGGTEIARDYSNHDAEKSIVLIVIVTNDLARVSRLCYGALST
jgi:hypothetical protein